MVESKIQAKISKYLKANGIYYLIPTVCSEIGHPDIIALHHGIFLGIEVKRPGKKPTGIQNKRARDIQAAGGIAIIATSLDDVIEALKKAEAEAAALSCGS